MVIIKLPIVPLFPQRDFFVDYINLVVFQLYSHQNFLTPTLFLHSWGLSFLRITPMNDNDIEKEKTTFRWFTYFNYLLLISSGTHPLLPYPLLYHTRLKDNQSPLYNFLFHRLSMLP